MADLSSSLLFPSSHISFCSSVRLKVPQDALFLHTPCPASPPPALVRLACSSVADSSFVLRRPRNYLVPEHSALPDADPLLFGDIPCPNLLLFSGLASSQLALHPRDFRSQKQESSERDQFYANLGSAIRTLREETPYLFYKDITYDIYREDIVFRDPRNTFAGIDNYKLIFWALRFHGKMFFKAIWVDVRRIWQPSDRVIIVRWAVHGIPRVPWKAQGIFEGTSEYKLDENGKIYEHKVNNVVLNQPPLIRNPAVISLLAPARCVTPTPTFFQRVPLHTMMAVTDALDSTRINFYWRWSNTIDSQMSSDCSFWYLT